MEEQRYDYDGQLYPRSSFLEEYGDKGAALWEQAKRALPPAAAKPPAAAAAVRDEGGGHAARARHMQPLHVERGASTGATPMGATQQRPRVNIVWHKCTDLRLHDHEALSLAHAEPLPVLHVFVLDPFWFKPLPLTGYPKTGAVRCKFLHQCLEDLRASLAAVGQYLCVPRGPTHWCVLRGPTHDVFEALCARYTVATVFAFGEVCSQEQTVDRRVEQVCTAAGGTLRLLWGFALYHIDDVRALFNPHKPHSYRTYSAFRRPVQEQSTVRAECAPPRTWRPPPVPAATEPGAATLPTDLGLAMGVGAAPPSDDRAPVAWVGGESAGLAWVHDYIWRREALARSYVGATNTMTKGKSAIGRDATSKISPWLAHGCVSPRRLFHEVERYEKKRAASKATGWIKHELVWRDYLRFAALAWGKELFAVDGIGGALRGRQWLGGGEAKALLRRWAEGKTGYPFVDCFMRELAATGYSTHCGRECACWFLVRDLGVDWRYGAEYFESILIDYEPTANWGNWVYRIASTTPPKLLAPQEETRSVEMLLWAGAHDPHAVHVRTWLPELACLPACLALEPWRLLARAEGVTTGPDGTPLLPPPPAWACDACTMLNAPEADRCDACDAAPPLGWGDFRYGDLTYGGEAGDYPLPVVRPKIVPRRVDSQSEADADRALAACPSRPACVPPIAAAGGPAARAKAAVLQAAVTGSLQELSLGQDASDGAARNTPQPTQLELWACPGGGETETPGGAPQASARGGAGGGKGRGRGGRRVARGGRLQNGY